MRKISFASTVPLLLAAALVAGCGSSSKSTSSSSSAPAASASTAASSPAGPYGSSRSAPAASTPAAAPAAATAVTVSTKTAKVGTVLAGRRGLTLYMFEADKTGSSSCTGACAQVWPPLTGSAHASGKAMSADLGTITRSDGTKQVTYKGHPLYYFTKDKDNGDAYGEGVKAFGANWYVLAPSGTKIDKS
jgi:predicted lipoprotein with Yx(FWY)xxD motif